MAGDSIFVCNFTQQISGVLMLNALLRQQFYIFLITGRKKMGRFNDWIPSIQPKNTTFGCHYQEQKLFRNLYNLELTFDIRKFINFLYCLFLMKPSHHPPRSHSNIKCKKQRLFFLWNKQKFIVVNSQQYYILLETFLLLILWQWRIIMGLTVPSCYQATIAAWKYPESPPN